MTIDSLISLSIFSPDMLTAVGLKMLFTGSEIEVVEDIGQAQAMLVDMGTENQLPDKLDSTLPYLALANDASAAALAIESGATGVLSRNGDPLRIPAAITAIEQGLSVIDPTFLPEMVKLKPYKPAHDLSKRELEVLELAGTGMSNKEIGTKLFISVHTVKFHLQSLLKKLGAKNRTEAVVLGGKMGLI